MKTERRHELQQNVLADWLGEKLAKANEYSRVITATVVGALVLLGLYMYMSQKSAARQEQVWQEYFEASSPQTDTVEKLTALADKAPDTQAGRWARLTLADVQLAQGCEQLFRARAEGSTQLADAEKNYLRLQKDGRESVIRERATIGLAKTYEALDRLDDAEKTYNEFLTKWPTSVFADFTKGRLADLKKPQTKDFYAWFSSYSRRSPFDGDPGIPGHKFNFDSNSLPAAPSGSDPFLNLGKDLLPSRKTGDEKDEPKSETPKTDEKKADDKKPDGAAAEKTETKPADAKPAETKPAETKATDAKPAATKPADAPKP